LNGVKEGCREGDCGACAILVGELVNGAMRYRVVASCLLPLGELSGRHVVTIEGLNRESGLTPIQEAFVVEGGSQCGFCTPGIVVALTGFCLSSPDLTEEEALAAMEGNICRCTGYVAVVRAVRRFLDNLRPAVAAMEDRTRALVRCRVLPDYFAEVPSLLESIAGMPEPSCSPGMEFVGGGTDLYVQRAEDILHAPLRFLSRETSLKGVWRDKGQVYVGGATSTEEMRESEIIRESIPGFTRFSCLISSQLIRNRATVAGNIVNASPIADLAIILLALNAELGLEKDGEKRVVPLARFFLKYKEINLRPGEIIEWIRFRERTRDALFNFEKVSRRKYLDIASVNTAMAVRLESGVIVEATIAAGGVYETPRLLAETSALVTGEAVAPDLVREAALRACKEISPISDVRGSKEYKSLLLRQLIFAHFITLFPNMRLEETLV